MEANLTSDHRNVHGQHAYQRLALKCGEYRF